MAGRNVIWSNTADRQFVDILDYWNKRNKSTNYSKKLISLVTQRTHQLAQSPLSSPLTDFNSNHVASLGNYSIFYRILDHGIFITAFWDNRQDPNKLLELLK